MPAIAPLNLVTFLDAFGAGYPNFKSAHIRLPVPGFRISDAYLEIYLRNFGRNETLRMDRTIITIASISLHPLTKKVSDKLDAMETEDSEERPGVLYGTGAFRSFLAELYDLAPAHGYQEVAIEELQNWRLHDVLLRQGYRIVEENGFTSHLAKKLTG